MPTAGKALGFSKLQGNTDRSPPTQAEDFQGQRRL
jgi:hypothetical protein